MRMSDSAKVLVVDDDAVTRGCLLNYLVAENYDVREAATAEEAERLLDGEEFELLLLDIRLPRKDGLTLTRELRARSDIGIILVSGRQDEVERIIGLECGADDYVSKPFNTREILARAKNLIRRVRQAGAASPAAGPAAVPVCEGCALYEDRRQLGHADG